MLHNIYLYFRDISFLYDAKIIEDRSKPLSAIAKSRELKPAQSKLSELGPKTPTIEVTFIFRTKLCIWCIFENTFPLY